MPNPAVESRSAENSGQDGTRKPTVVPPPVAANPEVSDRPHRRTFTAREKPSILREADQATGTGAIGAILRRHVLYSSALSDWRRQREAGTRGALTPARRGPKPSEANPLSAELAGALRENVQLKRRVARV
jgi:transposase-like protein